MIKNKEYMEGLSSNDTNDSRTNEMLCFDFKEDAAIEWLKQYAASFRKEFKD